MSLPTLDELLPRISDGDDEVIISINGLISALVCGVATAYLMGKGDCDPYSGDVPTLEQAKATLPETAGVIDSMLELMGLDYLIPDETEEVGHGPH